MAAIKRKAPLATRSHNFKESHPKSFRTFASTCNFNNKETLAERPATLTKRDSNTCVFLWILQTFKNNFFIEYVRWLLLNLGRFPQRFQRTHTMTKKTDSESHPSQSHHINACCKKSRHCYFIKLFQDSLHFLTLTKKLKLSFSQHFLVILTILIVAYLEPSRTSI